MDMFPKNEIEPPEPDESAREEPSNETSEAAPAPQPEASAVEPNPTEEQQPAVEAEPAPETAAPAGEPPRPTFEEAFAEMRQSLREEETKEKTGFGAGLRRWVQKVFRRRTGPLPEVTEARLDEFAAAEEASVAEAAQHAEPTPEAPEAEIVQETPEAVQEEEKRPPTDSTSFQKLVRSKLTGALPGLENIEPLAPPKEAPAEDETLEYVAPEQMQPQEEPEPAAPGQSILTAIRGEPQEAPEEVSSIRQAALEDYVVAPAEEEAAEAAPLQRRLRRSWRDMRPMDRTLLTGALAIIGVAILGAGAFAAYTARPTPTPPPVTPTTSTLPVPIALGLPGVPAFPLRTGFVQNGQWNPTGPEWLSGTEVCRWISLPYTVQLEAVLRTLKANDPIQLSMSNYDNIIYKVQSIQEVPIAQIQEIAPNTPSLLVILSKQDSSSRWVVTAKP